LTVTNFDSFHSSATETNAGGIGSDDADESVGVVESGGGLSGGRGEGGGGGGLDEDSDDDDHNYEITDFSMVTPMERLIQEFTFF